jgi:hypothetical protein
MKAAKEQFQDAVEQGTDAFKQAKKAGAQNFASRK